MENPPFMEEMLVPLTKSRIAKGFLAIPSYALTAFPKVRTHLQVNFDGQSVTHQCLFVPPDTSAKESWLFGLAEWFRLTHAKPGDYVGIELDAVTGAYSLTSDGFR